MGTTTHRSVNIRVIEKHRGPYYSIGSILKHAEVHQTITLRHIGYQTLEQLSSTQCAEVLTTGVLAQQSCNLPPHCGRVEYFKNTSTWFSEVGICVGLGPVPIVITIGSTSYTNNLYNVYAAQLTSAAIRDVLAHDKVKYMPHHKLDNNLNIVDLQMALLNKQNSDEWFIYAQELSLSYPLYSLNLLPQKPYTHAIDSRICIPTIQYSTVPIILGPMTKDEAIYNSMFTLLYLPGITPTTLQFITDYDSYMNGEGFVVSNNNKFTLACDPAKMTMTLLPITITSVLNTIGHALLILLTTILSALIDAIKYILRLIGHAANLYVTIILVIINIYKFRMSLFDSLATSIVIAIVVQYLHGHYNYGYN